MKKVSGASAENVTGPLACPEMLKAKEIARHNVTGTFSDADFPASAESITGKVDAGSDAAEAAAMYADIAWLPLAKIVASPCLLDASTQVADFGREIIQGELGDGYFLSAVAIVASHAHVLDAVVPEPKYADQGVYSFAFFANGRWEEVVVDERIPCDDKGPIFSVLANSDEFWLPLLEKAYAKWRGGAYASLIGGSVGDALAELTGGIPITIDLADMLGQLEGRNELLWEALHDNFSSGTHLLSFMRRAPAKQYDTSSGLLPNLAYPVLDMVAHPSIVKGQMTRLVRLRNPWGVVNYRGAWGDDDPVWTVEVMDELDHSPSADSTFWMLWSDALKLFTTAHSCHMVDSSLQHVFLPGKWAGRNRGGPPTQPTWFKNPQFRLTTLSRNSEVTIWLEQDKRLDGKQRKHVGLVVVPTNGKDQTRVYAPIEDGEARDVTNARSTVREIFIPDAGVYNVVAFTSEPGAEASFTIGAVCRKNIAFETWNGWKALPGSTVPKASMARPEGKEPTERATVPPIRVLDVVAEDSGRRDKTIRAERDRTQLDRYALFDSRNRGQRRR